MLELRRDDDIELTYTSLSPAVTRQPLKVSKRFERAITRLSTQTAVSHKWRWPSHINQLETDAQLLAVRHMTSCRSAGGHNVLALRDNTSTLRAVAKGRSSSFAFNKTYRRISSLTLANNITEIPHCIPTALNLADEPSRSFKDVPARRAPI